MYNQYNNSGGGEVPDFEKLFEDALNGNYVNFIKEAEKFAKNNKDKNKNKSNQLRNFYDDIVKINKKNYLKMLPMLKVKIAYSYGREKITKNFYNYMEKLIDATLKREEYIPLFKAYMEAFIGYNKYYETKEKEVIKNGKKNN